MFLGCCGYILLHFPVCSCFAVFWVILVYFVGFWVVWCILRVFWFFRVFYFDCVICLYFAKLVAFCVFVKFWYFGYFDYAVAFVFWIFGGLLCLVFDCFLV